MIMASREDWLVRIPELAAKDILTIYPRKNLDGVDVVKAMKAQGYNLTTQFRIEQHGSKIWIQRIS